MADVNMRILLSATGGSGVVSAVQSVTSALGSGGGGLLGALAGVGVAVGGMAVGLGEAAVSASSQFQTAMLANEAHAGLASSQVQNVTNALLEMGPAVGQGPTQLAQALYPVLSSFSGISDQSAKTQVSLTELKDAAESVAGSATSVTSVTNAGSAAFNAYGLATNDSATNISRMNGLFDVMNSTVSAGNMQWSNYATVIGKMSVTAHSAGVSFNEENAALADLTNSGYSAQLASTYLGNTFTQLDLKTDSLDKNAKKLGISFDEQKFKSMSLGDQIRYLNQITGGNSSEILKLVNNNSVAARTISALSNSIGNYQSNLDSLNHSQGATAQAFQIASQGFQFSMQKLQAAGQGLLITIGLQLLPTLGRIVSAVTPAVTAFGGWLTSGNRVQGMLNTVGTAIVQAGTFLTTNLIVPLGRLGAALAPLALFVIQSGILQSALRGLVAVVGILIVGAGQLINAVANIVLFFEHNKLAATALAAALIGIGVAIAAAVLPAMITAGITAVATFGAWAVAAAAAAIATLAAAAPFILIGLAVAALAFGIFMLIQHWSAVIAFLRGAWSSFASWFQGALHSVGAIFAQVWASIVSGLRAAWAFIVNVVKIGVAALVLIIFGPIIAIGALFIWLYQHNIYFQMLIDSIVAGVKAGVAFLVATWNTTIADIVAAWTLLSTVATTVWTAITSAISTAVTAVWNFLVSAWTTASSWISSQWNQLAGFARTAWSAVSSVFSSIWSTYISEPLTSLWTSISGWFTNLASSASSWGSNLIQGFINGILSMLGSVGNAVSQVASKVASFLGFHSPAKEGPGAELLSWPTNLIASYSKGLEAAIPQLQSSLNLVMQPVASTLSGGAPIPRPTTPLQGGNNRGATYNITVNLSTMARSQAEMKRTVDLFEQELGRRFRSQTPQYASGGVF